MLSANNRIMAVEGIPSAAHIQYHRGLSGAGLKYPRDVIVWLPPSYYAKPKKRFPVLYAQDGQNLFDTSTAFLGQNWRAHEVASRLIAASQIQEFIFAGIYNTPDRQTEYTPSAAGRNYARFVVRRLKPLIDRTYRTRPESRFNAVHGSSMGGLISFLLAWWYPEIFGGAACMSSSFFWNDYMVLKEVEAYYGPKKRIRFYLDVGSKEVLLREGYQRMVKLLKKKEYQKGVDLDYYFARGADHHESDWGRRLWRPLAFLFGS